MNELKALTPVLIKMLGDGQWHSANELFQVGNMIPPEIASQKYVRSRGQDGAKAGLDQQVTQGRVTIVLNRLRDLVKHGMLDREGASALKRRFRITVKCAKSRTWKHLLPPNITAILKMNGSTDAAKIDVIRVGKKPDEVREAVEEFKKMRALDDPSEFIRLMREYKLHIVVDAHGIHELDCDRGILTTTHLCNGVLDVR